MEKFSHGKINFLNRRIFTWKLLSWQNFHMERYSHENSAARNSSTWTFFHMKNFCHIIFTWQNFCLVANFHASEFSRCKIFYATKFSRGKILHACGKIFQVAEFSRCRFSRGKINLSNSRIAWKYFHLAKLSHGKIFKRKLCRVKNLPHGPRVYLKGSKIDLHWQKNLGGPHSRIILVMFCTCQRSRKILVWSDLCGGER